MMNSVEMSSTLHVFRWGNGWAVKRHGSARPARVFRTQKEAVAVARSIAQKSSSPRKVVVPGPDGRILKYLNFGFPTLQPPPEKRIEIEKAVGTFMLERLTQNMPSPGAWT
jgi:hypothetical protein